MKIIVFGKVSDRFVEVTSELSPHVFDFQSEVTSLVKNGGVILVNELDVNTYDGVILQDISPVYNYIWHETADIPWFNPPFVARTSNNHNYFFTLASAVGFNIPYCYPVLNDGKVTVNRSNYEGYISRVLVAYSEVISVQGGIDLTKGDVRRMRNFMKMTNAKIGVFSFIMTDEGDFYFTNFSSTPDWDLFSSKVINLYLERVIVTCRLYRHGKDVTGR